MPSAQTTQDHETIRHWAEERGGRPAVVDGTGGMIRIDFGDRDEDLKPISWDEFFQHFDESDIKFLYSPEANNRFNKFVNA
ncbi:MAG TPA: hypothetical protein VFL95_10165 [Gemmatimonadales bacterium]|nr:hypothetical protein [Gemmatimonadales bacterium]